MSLSNLGHDRGNVNIHGIIEELNNLFTMPFNSLTWNTVPAGVQNDPTLAVGSPVELDYTDLTDVLLTFQAPARGVRESTETNQALADFLNNDTDGIVTFMFAPPEGKNDGIVLTKELMGAGTYLQGLYLPPPEAIKPTPELIAGYYGQSFSLSQLLARMAKSLKSILLSLFKSAGDIRGRSNMPVPLVAA